MFTNTEKTYWIQHPRKKLLLWHSMNLQLIKKEIFTKEPKNWENVMFVNIRNVKSIMCLKVKTNTLLLSIC